MMWSRISCGRDGLGIVVSFEIRSVRLGAMVPPETCSPIMGEALRAGWTLIRAMDELRLTRSQ